MPESIECGGAEQLVGKRIAPFGEVQVTGQHGGAAFIAFCDQVMEAFIMGWTKGLESEVINDEQRDADQSLETTVVGIGSAGGMQISEEL